MHTTQFFPMTTLLGATVRCLQKASAMSLLPLMTLALPIAVEAQLPLPPQIVTQPRNVTVVGTNPATFSITATSTVPLTYQWRRGENILGDRPLTISALRQDTAINLVGKRLGDVCLR